MKKHSLLIVLILILTLRLFATSVSINDATDVAEFYLELYCDTSEVDDVVEFENEEEETIAYIANLDPQGFIVLSVNTYINPIISYSFIHDFNYNDDDNNIQYIILEDDMNIRIDAMNNGTLIDMDIHNNLWTQYLNENTTYFQQRERTYWPPQGPSYPTGGWLQTEWNQFGVYRNFCPDDPETNNIKCLVGCTATALSQVLNYHKYIGNREWTNEIDHYTSTLTTPSISIDGDAQDLDFPEFEDSWGSYSSMNTYLDELRTEYSNQNPVLSNDDKSALCYITGVGLQMQYSSTLSGIYEFDNSIILNKFNYDTADKLCGTAIMYINSLIPNMKNAQPALLEVSPGGMSRHEVVCDGYANNEHEEYFHINYGGNPTSTAWYNLPDFSGEMSICGPPIFNIAPPNSNGLLSGTVSLSGGTGDVTDILVTTGNKSTHPNSSGYYELELYEGDYDVTASLYGYDDDSDDVTITANHTTSNVNLSLTEHTTSALIVPTNYSTIQAAIDAADNGDMVIVNTGTYYENINFNGKNILVTSLYHYNQSEYYISNTVINGSAQGRVVIFENGEDNNACLNGFTITNGYLSSLASEGAGIYCNYSSPTLSNLKVTGNTSTVVSAIKLDHTDAILTNIEIYSNTSTSSTVSNKSALWIYDGNTSISHTTVYDNNYVGITVCDDNVDITMSNITIYDNTSYGIYQVSGDLTLENSLLWANNNGSDQFHFGQSYDLTINYCDIHGGIPQGATGSNNLNTNPLLVDPSNGDFQPEWDSDTFSPLIDTGNSFMQDPDGTRSDIGAVRAIDHKVETVELIDDSEGINWICFPVINTITEDADLAENWLEDIWDDETYLDQVEWYEDGNQYLIQYVTNTFTNPTHEFTSVQGYKFTMNQEYDLNVIGLREPATSTIYLDAGTGIGGQENWIGYYVHDSMQPLDAFEAVLDDIDMIQTKDFTLTKTALGWLGASNWTLNYGDLVIVNCTSNCSFFWGEDGGGTSEKSSRSYSQDFSYTEEADYLPVYVELESLNRDDPVEIGLFVDGLCKGAEVITDSLVQIRAYVCNDSTTFDPGTVEFQLSYDSRSTNTRYNSYWLKDDLEDGGTLTSLDFSDNPQSYYLISLTGSGNTTPEIIHTTLDQNFPNPFNPITTINYSIAQSGETELVVYNVKGQRVKTLVNEEQESGHYQVLWDGTDDSKKQVSSGIYFYRLKTSKKTLDKKMLMLK